MKKTKLKTELARHGICQRELARRCGLREAAISHYANGRALPSLDEAARMARVLEVPPARLFRSIYRAGGAL